MRIASLALLALGVWPVTQAVAHEWFSATCCSDRDCKPVAVHEVSLRADGWFINSTSELIPFGDPRIKQSLDPLMYVCKGTRHGAGKPVHFARCLYIPDPGI